MFVGLFNEHSEVNEGEYEYGEEQDNELLGYLDPDLVPQSNWAINSQYLISLFHKISSGFTPNFRRIVYPPRTACNSWGYMQQDPIIHAKPIMAVSNKAVCTYFVIYLFLLLTFQEDHQETWQELSILARAM